MTKNIPNILTITRFFLIPMIVYFLITEHYLIAFIFLLISALTDILDGFIARKFDFITDFGKLIDPLADKFTLISILIVMVIKNIIPFWILIIVVLKEFIMVSGASFLYGKELVVSSKWYGKLSTVLFYIAIVISLFIRWYNIEFPKFDIYIYYLALISTIFSLIMYFITFYTKGYLKTQQTK